MEFDPGSLFTAQPITGVTINTVALSPSFIFLLYILIAVVLIIATAVFLRKKFPLLAALGKAFIVVFFFVGIVYAVHADIGWSGWFANDLHVYSGLGTDQKLLKMEDGIYAFAVDARKMIPRDYMLFSTNEYAKLRLEYFLLPLRKREQSEFIIVLLDPEARYDAVTATLTRGDVKVEPVKPVFMPASNAYILRRLPS